MPTPSEQDRERAHFITAGHQACEHHDTRFAGLEDDIAAALTAARAEERERCATVVERLTDDPGDGEYLGIKVMKITTIAAAIRALGEEKPPATLADVAKRKFN